MSELTVLQLKCEFYCDEVRSNPNLFSTEDIDLYSKLKTVEEYLNTIVDEYENCYRNFPNQFLLDDVPFIPLNQLENLKEFIGKYHEAYKFKELKEAAKTVLKTLLKILTAPPK